VPFDPEQEGWRWERHGPHGLLLRVADRPGAQASKRVRRVLEAADQLKGIESITPAPTTLLFEAEGIAGKRASIEEGLVSVIDVSDFEKEEAVDPFKIPVRYNGEDLGAFAGAVQLSEKEVIRIHCEPIYHVEAIGFSPGFPYLSGLDPRLHLPRKETPRTRIPAGSVAIGGEQTGIYTIPTPGGWHLLGTTELKLFDRERPEEQMFLLGVGDCVKFVPL